MLMKFDKIVFDKQTWEKVAKWVKKQRMPLIQPSPLVPPRRYDIIWNSRIEN